MHATDTSDHNTSSVTEMIHSLDWPTLQERRLKTRLHIFYKIINNKIAVPYDNILISSQSRTRSTHSNTITGADPGFQVRGAHLKKLRRAEGGAKNVGVFRVKNHDFTQKKSDFFQMQREARKFLGYFV